MKSRGLYIGRFQPLHLGHLHAIKYVLSEMDEVIIVIGSAQYSHQLDNPFTAGERFTMVRKALKEARISPSRCLIIPIRDMHVHMMWVAEVEGYTPRFDFVYSNEPLTRRLFLEAGFQVKSIPFKKRHLYLATKIRERMLKDSSWTKLVPKKVAEYIEKIDGIGRLEDLTKIDSVQC
ncbi:MAG: nicotinamide-nucleotide adenylyltransferase [Candidatus Bathyarchaeota archaeon]|nr:MAG: nicotinamide-nucleotide adenylyltransferase [Candidatus Bathyarchaeota archaeon]